MKPKYLNYDHKPYEKFIRSKPCLVCKAPEVQGHHLDHARKNSFLLLPLCTAHHMPGFPDSYHQLEREAFEERHSINLDWAVMRFLMEYIDKGE
jgi:hypothetical protein